MKKPALIGLAAASVAAFAVGANSGLNVGETVSAFHPTHVAGPHKGTKACPPCTYGMLPQVQVWLNNDSPENAAAIAKTLQGTMEAHKDSKLKTFMIFVAPGSDTDAKNIQAVAAKAKTSDVALAWLPKNDEAVEAYKINTSSEVKNTILLYRDREVKAKFVNLKADEAGLAKLKEAIGGLAR